MKNKMNKITKLNTNKELSAPGAMLITGAKGKGGGARAAVEAENTLRSAAVARIVEVISEGPIEGLAGGARGIYINDVPFQNPDLSYNFPRAEWDYRIGLPTQDYMTGFSAIESEVNVGTAVTILSNNIARSVTSSLIDTIKVTIQLPQGLSEQDTTNGDLNGAEVTFRIETRVAGGTWGSALTNTITGKTTTTYEAQYRVSRPGIGMWEVRVVRVSPDPGSQTRNQIVFARFTEIQDIKVSYNDAAIVGLAIDAESVGNVIPKRAYLVRGMLIKIPNNYNPDTRTYSGIWNGTFVNSTTAVDNPAWVLYDAMTNTRYGAGIAPADIDKYSFYDAAVYCDAPTTFTNEAGFASIEPRFTFNARIADRPDMLRVLKAIAGSMSANLIYWNGKWTIMQDRPTAVSKLVTKSNTIRDTGFTYKSSSLQERRTAVNVSFNDRNDRHLERVVTVEDSLGIARYGYNTVDIAAYGCTTEGQAIRAGRWALDTELRQTEIVEFEMAMNGFDLMPGDVISLHDEDYADARGSGRIVSVSGTSVVLDNPCDLTMGSSISVMMADGKTIETRAITQTAGSLSTITIASAFSGAVFPQSDFVITTIIKPRPFRIVDITVPEPHIVHVMAVQYDEAKYARVETGIVLPGAQFTNDLRTVIGAPTNLTFAEESVKLPSGDTSRFLRAQWTPPSGAVAGYMVQHAYFDDNPTSVSVAQNSIVIPADLDGEYNFTIFSRDFNSALSGASLSGMYNFTSGGTTLDTSNFRAVTNLQVEGGGTWNTADLAVTWTDNPFTLLPTSDYIVTVLSMSDVELMTEVVDNKRFQYRFADNVAQGKRNQVKIRVVARDTTSKLALPTTVTFTNPPPALVAGLSTTQSFKGAMVRWSPNLTDTDITGYLVWRGTTAGFSPSPATLVFEGNATDFSDTGLADSTQYFYRVAAYDVFSRNTSGTGLNVTSSVSVTTLSAANVNEYRIEGITWTPNSPSSNQVSWTAATAIQTLGTGAGGTWAITAGNATYTSGILYLYYTSGGSTIQSSTVITDAIADNKIIVATYRGGTFLEIGNGRAFTDGSFIIAGTVGAAQLVAGSAVITQGAQIADTIISAGKLQTGLLSADNVLTRGLTVRDNSGNIILSATTPLTTTNAASGLVNSNITMNANGTLNGGGGGAVTIGGLGYTGSLAATRNITTRGASAPASPADGDFWTDTSVTPNIQKVRIAGSWQNASNLVTNTNQIVDGANLGGTATWGGVGSKPANLGALSGAEIINNAGITISSGAINGIGTGNGTLVSNTLVGLNNNNGTVSLVNAGTGSFVALTTANKLQAGNIASFFNSGAVTGTYIADATIGTAKIQNAAITSALIGNAAILSANIGDLQVTTLKVSNNSITSHTIGNASTAAHSMWQVVMQTAIIVPGNVNAGNPARLAVTAIHQGEGAYEYFGGESDTYYIAGIKFRCVRFFNGGSEVELGRWVASGTGAYGTPGSYTSAFQTGDLVTAPGTYTYIVQCVGFTRPPSTSTGRATSGSIIAFLALR